MKTRAQKEEFNSSPIHLFNLISNIEQQFPVDSLESEDGTKIWNLLRILIYFYLQKKTEGTKKKKNFFLKKMVYILWESIKPLRLPRKQVEFCGFSGTESRKLLGNFFYDIYMDPLYDILGGDYYVFEWTTPLGYRKNYTKNIYSKNYVPIHIPLVSKPSLRLVLYKLIKKSFCCLKSDNCLGEIIAFVCRRTAISEKEFSKYIYDSLEIFFIMKDFFYHILKKMCPKAIFLRCGYGRFHMALAQACRELNIPCIELQHGIITKNHVGYVKKTYSKNRDCLPEYILTYGNFFTDIIKKGTLFKLDRIITVGFPYLNEVINSKKRLNKKFQSYISNFSINLFITSQWTVKNKIKKFVIDLSNEIDNSGKNICIVFKPHPRDTEDYSSLASYNNIFVVDKFEDPYEIFKVVHIHSTAYSTCGIEALSFGVPNIFINIEEFSKEMFHLIDNKSSFIVASAKEYLDKLDSIISNYSVIKNNAIKKSIEYFKPGALNNIETFLNKILIKL